ncbi:hypothetical protein HBH75_005690 [Parastagonospora nodorum]|nr:hypothetical protein HBH75_005690 [Parastagonospora nodorum]
MEKIKSVFSGHKKSEDATHDAHASSTGAQHEGQTHPIYDQMAGEPASTQPTTATSVGQTSTSPSLGQTEHSGTGRTLGSHGATVGSTTRPGTGPMHEAMSEASIKSGVIGFGAGQSQGHAALSTHQNPEASLDRNQIVGGGSNAPAPTSADASYQPSVLSSAVPLAGSDQPRTDTSNTGALSNATQSSTKQPYDNNLRNESYTNDTDRSFPLAGGVAPKHDTSARHPAEHTSTTHHSAEHQTSSILTPAQQISSTHQATTSEREPGTKEKEAGVQDGHGREGLAGAAAAATAIGVAAPLSQSHQRDANDRGIENRQTTSTNTTQNVHPEALAAATAAAAKSSTMPPPSTLGHDSSVASTSQAPNSGATSAARVATAEAHESRYTDPGRPPGGRSLSYRHVPGGFPTPTPDESKTFLYYRDEVVPEPGVDGPTMSGVPSTRGTAWGEHQLGRDVDSSKAAPIAGGLAAGGLAGGLPGNQASRHDDTVGSGITTAGVHQSDTLNKMDPRIDSDLDGSRTVGNAPTTQHGVDQTSNAPITVAETSTVSLGQHELRHTGSLDHPEPRSAEHADEHHYGRDAAIVGGVGAGAAGLGYAATHKRDEPDVAAGTLAHDSSPYSSKQLDPRVLGAQAPLEEQRFDPQVKTETTHHGLASAAPIGTTSTTHGHHDDLVGSEKSTSGPHKSSLLNKLDPRVKNDSTNISETASANKQNDPEHHYGRDAALVGGGTATAAGIHHELQRNDTPGTGSTVVPGEQSSTTIPHQSAASSAPLSSSTDATPHPASTKKYEPYTGPMTTSGSPFYGTTGAPAPIADDKSSTIHTPAHATTQIQEPHTSTAPVTQHQDPQHHYGRDAGLAGAGLATAGGLAYAGQREDKADTGPASNTIGPHSSNLANIVDPRVQPDPSKQKAHTTTGPQQSDALNRLDPKVDEKASQHGQHQLGRDAALVGGAGATGYSAEEVIDVYGNHRSTQPNASMNEQRYDPSASGARAPNPVPAAGHYDYNNEHTRRNVALGSGAAALGAGGLYEAGKQGDTAHHVPTSSTQAPLAQSYPVHDSSATTYPTQGTLEPQHTLGTPAGTSQAPYASTEDPHNKDHTKRDAALLGTAGAAAAGGAAYAYNQQSDVERERERLEKEQADRLKKDQHAHDKEQHKLDKEHAKQEKEAHKLEKEQHKHEKTVLAAEKEEHKHEKEQEKEAHRLEKEREKEAARLEKEREKDTGTPEKRRSILGFLHRDKSKKEKSSNDNSPRQSGEVRRSIDNNRHSREYAGAAGGATALGAGTTAAAYDDSNNPDSPRWKGKNRLHKDPPKGHPAREALEHHELGEMPGKREHVGVDGPIGNPNAISGMHETRANTYGAEPLSGALGQPGDKVIEPHTGLPMNVGRYGDGHGGTDATPTIHGHHAHDSGVAHGLEGGHKAGTAPGQHTTNWEAVKKADTPY